MNQAEQYLLIHGGWLPARRLAELCNCSERDLRGKDSPIRRCAISGNSGYRHIRCATEEEFNHYCVRIKTHALEEIKHAELIKRLRYELGPVKQDEMQFS